MATYNAIAAVSRAMLGLIELQCPPELLLNPDFKLYHAPDFEKPMGEGFSVFLYRVSINASVRNLPPRRAADGRRHRPSLPVDLHYLLTAWAADGERQQDTALPRGFVFGNRSQMEEFGELNLTGGSPAFVRVLDVTKKCAACDATVLIQGETGTCCGIR